MDLSWVSCQLFKPRQETGWTCHGFHVSFSNRGKKLDLHIKNLTCKKLNITKNLEHFPELESRVKASRTKILVHYLAHTAASLEGLLPAGVHMNSIRKLRLQVTLIWSVSAMLHVWAKGSKPYLAADEVRESVALGRLWMQVFQKLAGQSVRSGSRLWRVRPKLHYLDHLLSFTERTSMNPEGFANWLDEDNMKWLAGIAKAVHSRSSTRQLARRYMLQRVMAWKRMHP